MNLSEKTYIMLGATTAISLIAWVVLIVIPAWGAYWRLRDRLLATVLTVYILAAFVLAGAGIGAVVLWYSDRI
jgi:hypothetical protein